MGIGGLCGGAVASSELATACGNLCRGGEGGQERGMWAQSAQSRGPRLSAFQAPSTTLRWSPPRLCPAGLRLHPKQSLAWQALAVVAFEWRVRRPSSCVHFEETGTESHG